jgi:hypothetical protein
MTTMTGQLGRRPSDAARLCAPAADTAAGARASAVGRLAVEIPGQIAPVVGVFGVSHLSSTINYIGTTAAGEGTSAQCDQVARDRQGLKVQADMAGGIPPRGRPV